MSNVQYRGAIDGNPDNSISFKALYGSFADNRKFEPSQANRLVRLLDPSKAYFWKWTWGSEVRLLVQEGIGGATVYNYSVAHGGHLRSVAALRVSRRKHRRTGALRRGLAARGVIRQVWISDKPRPDTLGNALD